MAVKAIQLIQIGTAMGYRGKARETIRPDERSRNMTESS